MKGQKVQGCFRVLSLHLNFLHGFFVSGALLSILIVGLHPAMRLLCVCVCLLGSPSLVGEGCAATCAPPSHLLPPPPSPPSAAGGRSSECEKRKHGSHALQLVSDWLSSDVMSRCLRKWRRRVRANLPIREVKSTSWFPHTPASKFACVEIFVKSYAQISAWTRKFSSCLVFWFVTRK